MAKQGKVPSSTQKTHKKRNTQGLEQLSDSLPTNYRGVADNKMAELMQYANGTVPFKEPRIIRGKKWYIEFYAWHPDHNQLKRKKLELDLNSQECVDNTKLRDAKAEQYRKEILAGLKEGRHFKSGQKHNNSIPQFASVPEAMEWVHERRKKRLESNSDVHYWNHIRHFIDFLKSSQLNGLKPHELQRNHYKLFEDYLYGQNQIRSNTTVLNTVTTVLSYLNDMAEYGIIQKNPFRGLAKKTNLDQVTQFWSFNLDQLKELKAYFLNHDPYIWQFAMFLFHAFIRKTELRYLQIKYIDFERNVIYVPPYTYLNGKRIKVAKKQPGEVEIFPELRKIIDNMNLAAYDPEKFIFSINEKPGCKPVGKNWSYNRFAKGLKALGYEIGNDQNGYCLYAMKHSGNEQYYYATKDVELLRRQNRHKYTATTDNYLRRLSISHYKNAVKVSI